MVNLELNVMKTESFSHDYPELIKGLLEKGELQKSRNGDTLELLNFKSTFTDPNNCIVYGHGRNINVFFLFIEAVWIWNGRKDVEILKKLNSQMGEYSDDGVNFHAPYGFRMRKYNEKSCDNVETNSIEGQEIDQIAKVIKMLAKNKEDRRAVISIWNPNLDLDVNSKDIPCNDMVMFKIRNNSLHTTIQNRSNDVHWGLPTNLYQFNFVSKLISSILNISVGTQTHNSQSLHLYLSNPLTLKVLNSLNSGNGIHKYPRANFKLNFKADTPVGRLQEIDKYLTERLEIFEKGLEDENPPVDNHGNHSFRYLDNMFKGCDIYLKYVNSSRTEGDRLSSIKKLEEVLDTDFKSSIEFAMMKNFFTTRLKEVYGVITPENL
jgi:thymidylate synthase